MYIVHVSIHYMIIIMREYTYRTFFFTSNMKTRKNRSEQISGRLVDYYYYYSNITLISDCSISSHHGVYNMCVRIQRECATEILGVDTYYIYIQVFRRCSAKTSRRRFDELKRVRYRQRAHEHKHTHTHTLIRTHIVR